MDGLNAEINPTVTSKSVDRDTDIDVVDLTKVLAMKTWGRPLTRPDGSSLTIQVEPNEQYVELLIGPVNARHNRDDILLLGGGKFEAGVVKIGRAAFNDPRAPIEMWGSNGPLHQELEKLRTK